MNAVLVIFGFPKTHSFCCTIVVEKHKHCSELLDVLQMKQHVLIIEEARFKLHVFFRTVFLQNRSVATNSCSYPCLLQHSPMFWAFAVESILTTRRQCRFKVGPAKLSIPVVNI